MKITHAVQSFIFAVLAIGCAFLAVNYQNSGLAFGDDYQNSIEWKFDYVSKGIENANQRIDRLYDQLNKPLPAPSSETGSTTLVSYQPKQDKLQMNLPMVVSQVPTVERIVEQVPVQVTRTRMVDEERTITVKVPETYTETIMQPVVKSVITQTSVLASPVASRVRLFSKPLRSLFSRFRARRASARQCQVQNAQNRVSSRTARSSQAMLLNCPECVQ
jgi:hypothetical protein